MKKSPENKLKITIHLDPAILKKLQDLAISRGQTRGGKPNLSGTIGQIAREYLAAIEGTSPPSPQASTTQSDQSEPTIKDQIHAAITLLQSAANKI